MNLNFERQKATFAACCDDSMARLKAPFSRNVFIGLIFCVLFLFVMYYYLVERRRHAEKLLDYFDAATSTENFTTHPSADVAPFIFIGGIPRSGTTLIRAMLDAHPMVRCGEETRIIPRILAMRAQWRRSEKEWKRLQEAGVDDKVINSAISAFIVQVITGHGKPAKRLCNKDPFTLKSMTYLAEIFPMSKFIFMIRDGRATVHSIISRKVTITGFNLSDFRQCMSKWNSGISIMYDQCNSVGSERCIKIWYEQLVLHPEREMRRLLSFLDLQWNESVLHHEMQIGKAISVSKTERSTDQIVKPINMDALTTWVGKIPVDVVEKMAEIAPMLRTLGYDPNANPPNYGTPDEIVLRKTEEVHQNAMKWQKTALEITATEDGAGST